MPRYNTVLLTGASRGLGAALARELLAREYRVILAARSAPDLSRLCEALPEAQRARAHIAPVDLARLDELPAFLETASRRFGTPDVLINNAGIGTYKPLIEWSPREITDCLNVNLLAPILLSRALLPALIAARHGMIVNIASDLSRRYQPNMTPYVASKFGLLGASGSLLREAKSHGIKVTSVLPGIIDSCFNGGREGDKAESWALRPALLASRVADLLELPADVVIDELMIHPLHQDF